MKYLLKILKSNTIGLVRTQINLIILKLIGAILENLFSIESHFSIMNNNSNELLSSHQRERIIILVWRKYNKIIKSLGYYSLNLGQ